VEKLTRGPVLIMTVVPNGPMNMSKPLMHWFVYTIVVSSLVAYVAAATLPADAAYLAKNPTGKFPCLELEDGTFIGESKVILNYLEDAYPAVPLLPASPLARARVRELMEVIDVYLELPARRLYREVFSTSGKVSEEVKTTVRPLLAQGVTALKALGRFDPYIAGPDLSLADFTAAFHFVPVSIASKTIYGEDVLSAVPAVRRHRELMDRRVAVRRVRAEQLADQESFMQRPT